MKSKSTVKATALLLAFSFICPYLGWAFDADNYPAGDSSSHVLYFGKPLSIPQNLGIIKQEFQGSEKTIVCLQDLHCNHEVQRHLASIIDYLAENFGAKLVGEEGAFGSVNVDVLKDFPLRPLAGEISDYFIKQGRLTGAEFAAANSRSPFSISASHAPPSASSMVR